MKQKYIMPSAPLVLSALLVGPFCSSSHAQIPMAPPEVPQQEVSPQEVSPQDVTPMVGTQPIGAQPVYPGLNSALWMRWSPEYRAASNQAYRLASAQLDAALRSRSWTAALEQKGKYSSLRPAIIFDMDETLFDNALYNAYTVRESAPYNEEDWKRWNESGLIRALPGALEFAKAAARKGVTLFYITNRSAKEKELTIQNLHRLGFPIRSADHLLLKGAQPAWKSDKTTRRSFVAQRYRVLLLIGDDFNDFVSAPADATPQQRLALQEKHAAYWGSKWIILPNPAYGSWERPLLKGSGPSPAEQIATKRQALEGFNGNLTQP